METRPLLIGCGAGFSGDRTDVAGPVVETLVRRGKPAFLIFETLAERTLALAQLRRLANPANGYEPLLDEMLRPVLADCLAHDIRIVGNFGAANPEGAARKILSLAAELRLPAPRVAVVEGDDVSGSEFVELLAGQLGDAFDGNRLVCANAYIGAESIADALTAGAQIVVAGRIADPALAVGPALAHFGWSLGDWDRIARATIVGHILECGARVTGGYFADPGYKEIPGLHALGFPIAEIDAHGHCIIGKADDTGGAVTLQTVKEQLLYEIHDPSAYLTPDVVADLTEATLEQVGENQVSLAGVVGHPRPASLKVTVFQEGGWLAEGEISYAGPGAERRARLAGEILRRRLTGLELRVDLIGVLSIQGDDAGRRMAARAPGSAEDVRLRVAASHASRARVERLLHETNALYTCGPAGGGGVRTSIRQRLRTLSCLLPREAIPTHWRMIT
ncbi:MAG: acyclic terpene utilization AtuA family protein [Gammaproteobacteria bacterium]